MKKIGKKQETNRICVKNHYIEISSLSTQNIFYFSNYGGNFENYIAHF